MFLQKKKKRESTQFQKIIISKIIKCETCEKNASKLKLENKRDILCPHCQFLKYKKYSISFNICSSKCKGCYWTISHTKSGCDVFMEDDECINCGKSDFPTIPFRKGLYVFGNRNKISHLH